MLGGKQTEMKPLMYAPRPCIPPTWTVLPRGLSSHVDCPPTWTVLPHGLGVKLGVHERERCCVSLLSVSWFAANGVCDEYHVIRHCMNLEAVNTYEGKPVYSHMIVAALVSYPDHIILLPHGLGMRLVSGNIILLYISLSV